MIIDLPPGLDLRMRASWDNVCDKAHDLLAAIRHAESLPNSKAIDAYNEDAAGLRLDDPNPIYSLAEIGRVVATVAAFADHAARIYHVANHRIATRGHLKD